MEIEQSTQLTERARAVIPGGVNSSARVLDPPLVFEKGEGAYIYDADGNKYIDYRAGAGPCLLGHNYQPVQERIIKLLRDMRFSLFGVGTTQLEIEAAESIVDCVPSIDKVVFCNSGSEATYHAIRLARAVTGRNKILKFQGCYHGFHDYVCLNCWNYPESLANSSSESSLPIERAPASPGIPHGVLDHTIILPFNDLDTLENVIRAYQGEIAALLMEPIPHNPGCLLPKEGFLQGVRDLTKQEDICLIFDEIITGFRHALGGVQEYYGILPDITCIGKSMANGYPVAAVGGKANLMDHFATSTGNVFLGGTYNGHPVNMVATIATLQELKRNETQIYNHLFNLGDMMREGMKSITQELNIQAHATGFGSLFVTYFMNPPADRFRDLLRNDDDLFYQYRKEMIRKGIFLIPARLYRNHISFSHTKEDIEQTLDTASTVLRIITS